MSVRALMWVCVSEFQYVGACDRDASLAALYSKPRVWIVKEVGGPFPGYLRVEGPENFRRKIILAPKIRK